MFWQGLKHRPALFLQSGGLPRGFALGPLLRASDSRTAALRRSISQSLVYVPASLERRSPTPDPRAAACLESLRQVLERSELCPPHPRAEGVIVSEAGKTLAADLGQEGDRPELTPELVRRLLWGWCSSQQCSASGAPVGEFDDECPGGSRQERRRWEWFQSAAEGRLRRWCHAQVLFSSLMACDGEDDRRADFVLSPPWAPALVWEVHGQYDARDQGKDEDLSQGGLATFNDVLGRTTDAERLASATELASGLPADALVSAPFNAMVEAAWACSQVDLVLLYLLDHGLWSAAGPRLRVEVPAECAAAVECAIARFTELASACGGIWGLDAGGLIAPGMEARTGGEADLVVRIDPFAPSYIAADEELSNIEVRRAGLPFDAPGLDEYLRCRAPRSARPQGQITEAALLPILERVFGHDSLRVGQLRAIQSVLEGKDALVLFPTGHGKSLIFQLAALILPGVTLVVEAWRALIDDQVRNLQDRGIGRVVAVHKDRRLDSATGARDVAAAVLVYVAPERLYVDRFQEHLEAMFKDRGCDFVVIDEAHAVSEAGHSFRPSYLGLADRIAAISEKARCERPPLLALTATAADIVVRDIRGILGIKEAPVSLVGEMEGRAFVRENLTDTILRVRAADGDEPVRQALSNALSQAGAGTQGIVFCVSKGKWTKSTPRWYGVDGTETHVRASGRSVAVYKGGDDMSAEERSEQTARFIGGDAEVMVATDAFGAGIDLPHVRWVVNVGLPAGIEAYYQQLGRAGRDGQPACGFLIVDEDSDTVLQRLDAARAERDSFESLRRTVADKRERGHGSFVRQLQFLVGDGSGLDPESAVVSRPAGAWLPSFPGWRFEAAVCDAALVRCLLAAGARRQAEFSFHYSWDSLVWKAVNRARELRLIEGSYRRTFAQTGLNKFTLFTRDLESEAAPERLRARLEDCVSRLRGRRRGRAVAEEASAALERRGDLQARLLYACQVLLANTYEAVRESRLGSLSGLRLYAHTDSQQGRWQLIEDFFSTDGFVKELRSLCESEPTPENWRAAFETAEAEGHWRIGTFQRLTESSALGPLPHFLLLAGLLHAGRGAEAGRNMAEVFDSPQIPSETRRWAWQHLFRHCGPEVREQLDALVAAAAVAPPGTPRQAWLAEELPNYLSDSEGASRAAYAAVGAFLSRGRGDST
jgi:RecQ family ATP-dependent DNA helicase